MAEQKAEAKLSAGQRSKIRRLAAPQELSADDEAGELNIVPFLDMVVNILMFVLATVAVTFTATIETTPPSSGGGKVRIERADKALNLTVIVTNDGVALKAAGGNISTGCDGVGPGITFPTKNKGPDGEPVLDADAITECVRKLKDSSPDFKEETQIRITASNNISYRKVIECIDAVRKDKNGNDMFPDVLFGVPR
ncbi:MAG: biopolymer transporter ExbD [Deltaproteobacteria bacterium]|nr:biopolymer transporter ExbD [Deltaproteobacteria bacterium]